MQANVRHLAIELKQDALYARNVMQYIKGEMHHCLRGLDIGRPCVYNYDGKRRCKPIS